MTTREAQDAQVEGGMSNEHVHEALARSRFRVEIIVKIKYKSAFSYQRYHSPKMMKCPHTSAILASVYTDYTCWELYALH